MFPSPWADCAFWLQLLSWSSGIRSTFYPMSQALWELQSTAVCVGWSLHDLWDYAPQLALLQIGRPQSLRRILGEGGARPEQVEGSTVDGADIHRVDSRADCAVLLPAAGLLVQLGIGVQQEGYLLLAAGHICYPHAASRLGGVPVGPLLLEISM